MLVLINLTATSSSINKQRILVSEDTMKFSVENEKLQFEKNLLSKKISVIEKNAKQIRILQHINNSNTTSLETQTSKTMLQLLNESKALSLKV
jgi:hypothetical protein